MDSEVGIAGQIGRLLSFNADEQATGIEIVDHIERRRCKVETPQPVAPTEISTEEFYFPVDQGVSITTDKLSLPHTMAVYIRNHRGFMVDELTSGQSREFPIDRYSIELPAPIKLYISVESKFKIEVTSEDVTIQFPDIVEICIGARSHHEKPAATISITDEIGELMKAISYFSSAIKTTSCERSYPTLRGHPPRIKRAKSFDIPSVLNKPDTGIKIQLPERLKELYIIAPLAYYLGADVVPGKTAMIKTDQGYTHNLEETGRGFENEVNRVLKQCFFLDCITRTEGYYQIALFERDEIENQTRLDFELLYDHPISDQIKSYLSIPYKVLKPYIPKWKQTAHVETNRRNVGFLPYLVNDLAIVHSAEESQLNRSKLTSENQENSTGRNSSEVTEFVRQTMEHGDGLLRGTSTTPSARSGKNRLDKIEEYVEIPDTDALEQIWVGEGIPLGASKSMIEAFENRLRRKPTAGDIDITVIVNDDKMDQEGTVVDEIYGSRDQLALTVNAHRRLSVDELHDHLKRDTEFLHYIGHIDENGFECTDGQLDVEKVSEIGVDTFLLNACSSYQQAIELINSGAIAGIATLKPVLNSGAERVGMAVARLLNLGFPFISALEIAKSESIMGENYIVIGDGGVDLTQPKSGIPSLCEISKEKGIMNVRYNTYVTRKRDLGTITIPYATNNEKYFLASGETGIFMMDKNELIEFVSMGEMPIQMDGLLYWSDENRFLENL